MLLHSLLPVLYSAYIQTISTVGISILTCYLSLPRLLKLQGRYLIGKVTFTSSATNLARIFATSRDSLWILYRHRQTGKKDAAGFSIQILFQS